jgi:hypothetical protein
MILQEMISFGATYGAGCTDYSLLPNYLNIRKKASWVIDVLDFEIYASERKEPQIRPALSLVFPSLHHSNMPEND